MTIPEKLKEMRERNQTAHREICDLASGKRKWEMCVPVQQTDSDMVLQAPLDDQTRVIAALERAVLALIEISGSGGDTEWAKPALTAIAKELGG